MAQSAHCQTAGGAFNGLVEAVLVFIDEVTLLHSGQQAGAECSRSSDHTMCKNSENLKYTSHQRWPLFRRRSSPNQPSQQFLAFYGILRFDPSPPYGGQKHLEPMRIVQMFQTVSRPGLIHHVDLQALPTPFNYCHRIIYMITHNMVFMYKLAMVHEHLMTLP
ncbi:hypothetical protein BDW62DRAFT_82766 [Aspergillus aurantiobrunneus]